MGFLQDFLPVFRKSTLTFAGNFHEAGNIMSFLFQSSKPMIWKAGQHGIFSFDRKLKGGSWRGFSVASSPEEGIVRISTRIPDNPSAFKKALSEMRPGEKINMRGPFGTFYLDGSGKPVVFIAGGIGVTPYRSLILHCAQDTKRAQSSILLLYADNSGQFAYRQEFEEAARVHSFIKAEYLSSDELYNRISEVTSSLGNNAQYFLSGPPKMLKDLKGSLIGQGIKRKNIIKELFLGL